MKNIVGVDFIGVIHLLKNSGRDRPIRKSFNGSANLAGSDRQDSCYIFLLGIDALVVGEKAKAEFKYKFSNDDKFVMKLKVGQVIELNEGSLKAGEFVIQEIVNEKFI